MKQSRISKVLMVIALICVFIFIAGVVNYKIQETVASKIISSWYDPGNIITMKGKKIHVYDKGKGKPLVFIHGSQMSLYDWRENMDYFSRSFRVIAVDMPGNGYSDKPDAVYSPDYYAGFIKDLLDHYNLSKTSFVASSWGGGHVLNFALKHPDRIDRLVLSSPCGFPHEMTVLDKLLATPGIGQLVMYFSNRSMIRSELELVFHDKAKVTDVLVDSVFKPLYMPGALDAVLSSYQNDDFSFVENNLSALKARTLLVWGEKDGIHPQWMLSEFRKGIPHSRTLLLKDCGHLPHEEHPEVFNKSAMAFLMDKSI